jgi:hypothetical protein
LGNGTATLFSDVPVKVSGLSDVTAVAAGSHHDLALLKNGTVMSWGENAAGELGDGTSTGPETCGSLKEACSRTPVAVSGLGEVTSIAAGGNPTYELGQSMALLQSGKVMAWGANLSGDLGVGTTTGPERCEVSASSEGTACSTTPVAVSGITEATAVACGGYDDLALLKNGTALASGYGLASGTGGPAGDVPVPVDGLSEVSGLAAGTEFGLALGTLAPIPTVTALEPSSGSAAGGTSVKITGTNFSGATAVKFGSTNATNFTVSSESSISATAPPGTGVVNVTVATAAAISAIGPADRFTYLPAVSAIEPNSGPVTGGTGVTITGTNFTGATEVKFGSAKATSFTVNSPTSITAVSPASAPGMVDVTVITPGGTSPVSAGDRFGYGPNLTLIFPASGPITGGTSVTIEGVNLNGASEVKFGSKQASFTVDSSTMITATAPAGEERTLSASVTVTTPEGTSPATEEAKFLSLQGCQLGHEPTVTAVEPHSGPSGTSVTIRGQGFHQVLCTSQGWSVRRVMFGTKEASFKFEGEGVIVATAPPGIGTVDLRLEGAGASPISPADQFTYTAAPPPVPTVTRVEANHGPAAGGTSVTITGTNLTGATAVKFGSRSATSFTVNSESSITAVAPPWGSGDGVAEVTVTTPGGTSALSIGDSFVYEPTVTKVEPAGGPPGGGTTVTISGAAFEGVYTNGSGERPPFIKAVKFGSASATSIKLEPTGQISAVAPPGTGTVDVTVSTEGGTSAAGPADQFSYEPPSVREEFKNWVLSGALHDRKLNQAITLPEGSRFNGMASIDLETMSGPLSGTISVPAFTTPVKIFGFPATIAMELAQAGSIEGSIEASRSIVGDFSLSLPVKANLGFSSINIFGLKIPTKCLTAEPLAFNLLDTLSLEELTSLGANFTGTTNFPAVKCEGTSGALDSSVLSSLFSGPSNSYSLMLAP